MGKGPKAPPAPERIDPNESAGRFLFGDDWEKGQGITDPEFQNRLIEAEATFGPEYIRNALALQEAGLFGIDGQGGLLSMQAQAAPELEAMRASIARAQREADLSDVELFGARATQALRDSDPERAALIAQQQSLVNDLYDRAQRVTPEQARMAEQSARESLAARGREMDNVGIFAEALGRENIMRQNRAEAQQAGAGLFGMLSEFGGDPLLSTLGRPSRALPYGQQSAAQAAGLAGNVGPGLFNPDTGINVDMQNNANTANYNASVYGADQARRGATMGGVFGGLGSILGGIF